MEEIFVISTPVGNLEITVSSSGVQQIQKTKAPTKRPKTALGQIAQNQLKAYFAGKQKKFDLPLDLQGTDFQKTVWTELTKIPYGHSISYGEVAKRIGRPKAYRAVGMANHRNPIMIVVPCHRVVGTKGQLTGYAGGIDMKEFLLRLEGNRLV